MKTKKILTSPALLEEIGSYSQKNVSDGELTDLTEKIKHEFGDSLCGIILYGSCLRSKNFHEGVIDLYVIVSSYKSAYKKIYFRALNSFLPPNVFYLESGSEENKIRAKYAVISFEDFQKGVHSWFHSYIWSRFAQPAHLIYASDDDTRQLLYALFAESVIVFLKKTIPALGPGRFDTETIWENGLGLTYAAELRPEQKNRASFIPHQTMDDLIRLTQHASPALSELIQQLPGEFYQCSTTSRDKKVCLLQWRFRRWQGHIFSVFRLMKAVFTFKDCVDYAAWKIKRHTGISIEVTPVLQKHPILFGFTILWRLLKHDAIH